MPLAFPSPAAKRFEEEDVSSPSPATASNSPAFAIDPGLLDQEHASNPNYFQYVGAVIASRHKNVADLRHSKHVPIAFRVSYSGNTSPSRLSPTKPF